MVWPERGFRCSINHLWELNNFLENNLRQKLPDNISAALEISLDSARRKSVCTGEGKRWFCKKISSKVRDILEEPGITGSLLSIEAGHFLVNHSQRSCHSLLGKIGEFLIKAPLMVQATSDLREYVENQSEGLSVGNEDVKKGYEELACRYGLSSDSLLFHNPQIIRTLRKSFVFWGPYGEINKYLGFPVQAAISALFLYEPTARNFVDQYGLVIGATALTATGIGALIRREVETKVIEEVGYNPDFMATCLTILTGKRNNRGDWIFEPRKWVGRVIGLDLAKTGLLYNLPLIWENHLFMAALVTNVLDQIYSISVNSGFLVLHRLRRAGNSNN